MSDDVIKSAASVLKIHQFVRKGSTWYFRNSGTVLVVNFQRAFGTQYYINIAIWIAGLEPDTDFPKEHHCHIRARLRSLAPSKYKDKEAFLSLGNSMVSSKRNEKIKVAIEKTVLPFLFRHDSIEKICGEMPKLEKRSLLWIPLASRRKFAKLCRKASWEDLF